MKDTLEMGQRLLNQVFPVSQLSPQFFSFGVTAAILKSVGTIPVVSEKEDDSQYEGEQRREVGFDESCGERIQQTSGGLGITDEV